MQHQIDVKDDLTSKIDLEIQDKVRVDEVQDALRRLTESFQSKLETTFSDISRTIQLKNDDTYSALERLKMDIDDNR